MSTNPATDLTTPTNIIMSGTNLAKSGIVSGSWTSPVFPLEDTTAFSVQLCASGTLQGTVQLQVTNEPGIPVEFVTPGMNQRNETILGGPIGNFYNWMTIPAYTQQLSGSGGLGVLWNLAPNAYQFAQVVFTLVSGTGPMILCTSGRGGSEF
jgi:hypothetical protein